MEEKNIQTGREKRLNREGERAAGEKIKEGEEKIVHSRKYLSVGECSQ